MPKNAFTLIELLVTISIIAILAVIGISVYGNVQKSARDGVRRAELTSLAKSIEVSRDLAAQMYSYSSTNYASDYGSTKPKDPSNGTPTYCYATSTGASPTMPGNPTAWATTSGCPTLPAAIAGSTTGWSTLVDNSGVFTATGIIGVKYWKICTLLEGGTAPNVYCVASQNP